MKTIYPARFKIFGFLVLTLAIFLVGANAKGQQTGGLDLSFNSNDQGFGLGDGTNNVVYSVAVQADNKIIIGGAFGAYNSTNRQKLARLNTDGTLDLSFDPASGADQRISKVLIQPDGKIIIAGAFATYRWANCNRIARINTDGTLDQNFNPGTGANYSVETAALLPDGKILIGGLFTAFNNDTSINRIARLNTDGTLDTTFNAGSGANNEVSSLLVQPDGKILICGSFNSYDGVARNRIARLNTDGSLDITFDPGAGLVQGTNTISLQANNKIIVCGRYMSSTLAVDYISRLNPDGTLDTSFIPGTGPDGIVVAAAVQADDKIYISGQFSNYNGTPCRMLARLNADGSFDASFNVGTGPNSQPSAMVMQPDGKVLIAGFFMSYNGKGQIGVTRLHASGGLDMTFNPSTGANSDIITSALQADGKILLGGYFKSYNGTSSFYFTRVNADGSYDSTFNYGRGPMALVRTILYQPNGKIMIGGYFGTYDWINRKKIARLNSNGSLDMSFNPGLGANDEVATIAIQPDGKYIIGGFFSQVGGLSRNRIARLNSDGTLDTTFDPGAGASGGVYSVKVQADGKILIGGSFGSYNGVPREGIARLHANGALDTTFDTSTSGISFTSTVVLQPDGKIILGGNFNNYNGISRKNIVRINSDATLDTSFSPGSGANMSIHTVSLQPDGKIIIGGAFTEYNGTPCHRIARLNYDGTLDTTLTFTAIPNDIINTTVLQPDGKIIIAGRFTSCNGIGRNRIARLISTPLSSAPPLLVNQLTIYPNPFFSDLKVKLPGNLTGKADISLTDLAGSLVYSHFTVLTSGQQTLSIKTREDLQAGTYLLQLRNGSSFFTTRVVKH